MTGTTIYRGGAGEIETFAMANCLMLLSSQQTGSGRSDPNNSDPGRAFTCKTCGRKFPSFQALGGHRASHNKNKPLAGAEEISHAPVKPKSHACSICGLEFPIGQALGGHMRRHRAALSSAASTVTSEGSDGTADVSKKRKIDADVAPQAVLKKVNSGKRVYLSLDLNLFPPSSWEQHDDHHHDGEIEQGEIVEQAEFQQDKQDEEHRDFLKLELGLPIH